MKKVVLTMIKLLICDDEPWICSLLQRFIDFEAHDIHLIGFAYDGLTALEKIRENQPDIVITDIYDVLPAVQRLMRE